MDDYIRREDALKGVELFHCGWAEIEAVQVDYIGRLPAADVAEVVHGHWETNSDRPDSLICSVCKCGFDMWKHDPHNYCPNCGAKMDGGDGSVAD